jgi:hypothetical protein
MASDGLQIHGEAYNRLMPKTTRVTRGQIMAFRMQRLNIARRARALGAAVGDLGLPDYPPGAALDALGARLLQPTPDTLDAAYEARVLVRMRAMRGAPLVVRPADYDTFIAGVLPHDEAAMRAFIGPAMISVRTAKSTALEAVSLVSQVTRRALGRGPLDRDQLHAELRDNLPEGLLPHCRACNSNHAHPALIYAVALDARLVLFPRDSGPYLLARFDRWMKKAKTARAQARPSALLQRFLQAYAPATISEYAAWAGISTAQARRSWEALASDLEPVRVEHAKQPSFVLGKDLEALTRARPDKESVHLLAPGDPLLQARDRELFGDRAFQAVVWKNLSPRGIVLVGGEVAGVVRLQREKSTLRVSIQGSANAAARAALEKEAAQLAQVRGLGDVQIEWTKASQSPRSRK